MIDRLVAALAQPAPQTVEFWTPPGGWLRVISDAMTAIVVGIWNTTPFLTVVLVCAVIVGACARLFGPMRVPVKERRRRR